MPLKDVLDIGQELIGYGATFSGVREKGEAQKMRDLLAHPDFNKLSQAGQIQYFGKIFPDFANLSPGEFQQVRNRAAESPLINAGEEGATNLLAGEMGGKIAGETLSAAAPALGKAGGLAADIGRTLVPKRFSEARAARGAKEALSRPKTFGTSVPTEKYAGSKYTKPPEPGRPATKAPPLRPNIPEKPAPKGATPAPPLRPNVPKTTQEVGRTTTPAPPLRPNIFPQERELEEGTEAVLTKPRVSAPKGKESPTAKANEGTAPKTSKAPDLETQLKKSLESPKAKPPEPPPAEKKDYTKTDAYARDKAAKNEKVVEFLKGKGISKQAWRDASLDQKNKWIRDAVGSKHREYREGEEKAATRTKEIEDLLPDIDAQQRFGTAETPQVREFLGHPEPKKEPLSAPKVSNLSMEGFAKDDPLPSLIKKTAKDLAGDYDTRVQISDLKRTLSQYPSEQVDAALKRMQTNGDLVLYQNDDPIDISAADRKAALKIGGEPRHLIYMHERTRVRPTPKAEPPKVEAPKAEKSDLWKYHPRGSPPPKIETPKEPAPQPKAPPEVSKPKVSAPRAGLERPPGWEKGPADKYFKFDISRRAGEEPYVHWDEDVPLPEHLSDAQLAKAQELIDMVNKRSPGAFGGIQDRLNNVRDTQKDFARMQGKHGTSEARKRDIHELLHSVNPEMSKRILEAK